MPLRNHPLFLLLSTGFLLGLYFPMGKFAAAAGASPLLWSLIISMGPGLVLAIASARLDPAPWHMRHLPFALVSGLLAYVIPNVLTFAAIPRIGSGLASLMFAFSPVFTALLSLLLGVRPPNARLLSGVAFGFVGAMAIVFARDSLNLGDDAHWLLLAFLTPVSLALGNVYRTAYWPDGMAPLRMAATTTLTSGIVLLGLVLSVDGAGTFAQLARMPWLAALQILISGLMFLVFFRLQWVGGPTYLSQIGYVSAAVGLGAGLLFLGETYPLPVWCGAAAIAVGIIVSHWPDRAGAGQH